MIDMIIKPENIMNKLDKGLEAFSLFTSVSSVVLITTKNKTQISRVFPIFALLLRYHGTNDTNRFRPWYGQ